MKKKNLSYDEAKAYLKPLGLKSKEEYEAWWDANKPDFLPRFPEEFYSSEPKEKVETTTINETSLKESQRTIDEVLAEIREIIDNTHWVQTRLAKLESSGYYIEECWVKNGSIETIWYMKQKKVLRIQVAESEPRGDHHKAKCVIIPASDIQFQKGDEVRVRHLPNIK